MVVMAIILSILLDWVVNLVLLSIGIILVTGKVLEF